MSPLAKYQSVRSSAKDEAAGGLESYTVPDDPEGTETKGGAPSPGDIRDGGIFARARDCVAACVGPRDHDPLIESLVAHLSCAPLRWWPLRCVYWGILQPVLRLLCRLRWALARALQTPVVPRRWRVGGEGEAEAPQCPGIPPRPSPLLQIPFVGGGWSRALRRLTYGQLLVGLYIFWWVATKVHFTYTRPSQAGLAVGWSGVYATRMMLAAFFTAYKANNALLALGCGLSFVDLIPWHAIASALTLALGIWHGVIAYQRWGLTMSFHGVGRHRDSLEAANVTVLTKKTEQYYVTYNLTADTTSYVAHLGVDYGLAVGKGRLWPFLWDGWVNWSGTGLVVAFAVLVLSSWLTALRRRWYRLWFALHLASCLATLYFGWVHFEVVRPLFVWWGLDWAIRYGVLVHGKYARMRACVSIVPNTNLIKLSWPRERGGWLKRSFHYQPGQFVKVAVPSLGYRGTVLDFHPISLLSSPHEDTVQVLVRPLGSWSKQVHELVLSLVGGGAPKGTESPGIASSGHTFSSSSLSDYENGVGDYESVGSVERSPSTGTCDKRTERSLPILVEGPYGSHSLEYPRRELSSQPPYVALFVSGGVGVAPMQSIALDMLHWHRRREQLSGGGKLDGGLVKLRFVWSVRELELVESILSHDLRGDHHLDCNGDTALVVTEIYHTRGSQQDDDGCEISLGPNARIHSARRPDLGAVFRQTKEDALLHRPKACRILVFCCGPAALTNEVDELCHTQSTPEPREKFCNCFRHQILGAEGEDCSRGVTFELHKEVFEF